jgi:predicted lysophospholipase L1 biosynthesis ABC-type transport system permease subunit
VLAEKVFKLDYSINPTLWFVGLLAGCVIVGVTGIFATRRAVNEPPIVVLRDA